MSRPTRPAGRPVGPRKRRRQRSTGSRILSVALYGMLGLLCLVLASATFLMIAAPTDLVRDQIVAQVEARTGRKLELAGPASFTFFPSIGVRLTDVTLSAPPGMQAPPLARMQSLDVAVRVLPLLQEQVIVDRLVLHKPVFELIVDGRGRNSWSFAALESDTSRRIRLAQADIRGSRTDDLPPELKVFARNASGPPPAGGAGKSDPPIGGIGDLALTDVRIQDGTVRYKDQRTGTAEEVGQINARLAMATLSSPLSSEGSLTWKGEALAYQLTVTSPKALLDGRSSKVVASVSGRPAQASYEGSVTLGDAVGLDGNVSTKTESLRRLAKWLGSALPDAPGYGKATLTGKLGMRGEQITLAPLDLKLDTATANGTVSANLKGARPHVKADLSVSAFDLAHYVPAQDTPSAPGAGTSAGGRAQGASLPKGAPSSIEDILNQPANGASGSSTEATRVRGYEKREGWNTAAIDVSPLRLLDADVRLKVAKTRLSGLTTGQARLVTALKAGQLRLDITELQLYEGGATGFITFDARNVPAVAANIQVRGVSAQPLLRDVAGMDWLAGRSRVSLALAGRGASERAIIETLTGRADFTFEDGAIVGYNVPKAIRGLTQGQITSFEKVETQKTDFSELSATFQIDKGVAVTRDLQMLSPLLRVTGEGNVAMPPRQLDMLVKPRLVASLAGQGGARDTGGLEIPVRIKGPWDDPGIAPDLNSVLQDPNKAIDAIRQVGEQFKGKDVGQTIRNLLGGSGGAGEASGGATASGAEQPPSGQADAARNLLKNLFKN